MDKPDDEPGFFSTPTGWIAIALIAFIVFFALAGLLKGGNGNRNYKSYNNNYHAKMGTVHPSLAGYI